MGHIVDTTMRRFRAIRMGISTAAQMCKVKILLPKTSVLPQGAFLDYGDGDTIQRFYLEQYSS